MWSPVICVVFLLPIFFATTHGNFFEELFNPGLDKSPKFSDSQLYLLDDSVNSAVGLNDLDGYIGCFGDFNSDKYMDLFIIVGNNSETRVHVYLWLVEQWQFVNHSTASIAYPYITNIAAGDFNYDGKLDLMVSGLDITTNNTIHTGNHDTLSADPLSVIDNAATQVTILDANNDLHLDFFGETLVPGEFNSTTNTSSFVYKRVFWINDKTGKFTMQDDPYGTSAPLMHPHSSAFVDIDGDCLADRFVVSQDSNGDAQYELLINAKAKGYVPPSGFTPVKMPLGSGQVSFADFDKDGNLDFIIPVCYPQPNCTQNNSIKVIFNKQKPICSLLTKSATCRSTTELCVADPNFKFGDFNDPSDPYYQDVEIANGNGDHFYFDNDKGKPLTIRVGDFNLDGYPDLLIPIIGSTGRSRIELWQNVPVPNGRRTFQKVTAGVEDLLSIPDAYAGAFFDLSEDGVVDMFVLADNPIRIETIYNNFENDAFFLKTLGLNGVCTEWCPTKPKFPSPKPYGVNYAGAVFKFAYTDLSGKAQIATGTQLSQSAYLPLVTPYTLFGLGRTSNYIEQFFFGVPLNQTTHFNFWTGSTIPNSQLVAVPYKYDAPAGWTLELYITPSGLLFWIMIALIVSLIILAVIVYIFYRKEKKEDEQKKQEQAHLFSFDAL